MAEPDHTMHVLLLPYPTQGHVNPLLQFGKRLAARSTLAAVSPNQRRTSLSEDKAERSEEEAHGKASRQKLSLGRKFSLEADRRTRYAREHVAERDWMEQSTRWKEATHSLEAIHARWKAI